jgi:hypothetical protein
MTGTVDTGRYVLELGRPSGTLISSPAQPKDGHPRPLRRALENGGDRRRAKKSADDPLANVVDIAAEATAKAERAVALFRALAEGSLDAKQLVGEIDALVALVERLDRDGHWQEALELARALPACSR